MAQSWCDWSCLAVEETAGGIAWVQWVQSAEAALRAGAPSAAAARFSFTLPGPHPAATTPQSDSALLGPLMT